MSIQLRTKRAQRLLPRMLLILTTLFVPVASASDGSDLLREASMPTVGGSPIRVMLIRGVVEPIEKNFFGRTERVALVFVNSDGVLIQNPVAVVNTTSISVMVMPRAALARRGSIWVGINFIRYWSFETQCPAT